MVFPIDSGRRRFLLRQLPVVLGVAALPPVISADDSPRVLDLHNLHTQERLECWYYADGEYQSHALKRISRLFRDHRTHEQHQIDTNLLDTLFYLRNFFDAQGPIEILSGFRSASTNAMLRRRSSGVARNSYHLVGRAVDCRFPEVPMSSLRDAAILSARGGVGYYPKSRFVHLDTGPVRHW